MRVHARQPSSCALAEFVCPAAPIVAKLGPRCCRTATCLPRLLCDGTAELVHARVRAWIKAAVDVCRARVDGQGSRGRGSVRGSVHAPVDGA